MVATLKEMLGTVEVMDPLDLGPLQIFGLRWDVPGELEYTLLDDVMAGQTLQVNEVSEGGSVPTLSVTNNSDTMVFFMAGEQLIGAKQNRVLNVSLVVAQKSKARIPVSCVEQGRWGYRSRAFRSGGTSSHSHLRAEMSRQVAKSYKLRGMPSSDQREVWAEVDRKLCAMSSVSSSAALQQAYEDHENRLHDVLKAAKLPETCQGVVFAFGGRVAGMDLFDRPATLQKLVPKLVRAYAIDALETREAKAAPAREDVQQWVQQVREAEFERFDSPGIGDDVRITANELTGAGLVVEGRPIHVELFPTHRADEPESPDECTGP